MLSNFWGYPFPVSSSRAQPRDRGQYHLNTGSETTPWCYVFLLSNILRLSVCKKDFSATLSMTIRKSSSLQSPATSHSFFKETLIKSLFDFTLVFSCSARNNPTRIASYLRRVMTKRCMKIHVKSNSAIESAFP